jgi:hypothetical protein
VGEIIANMSVSIPDDIYEKFLAELASSGFVFTRFGDYSLVLSMPDIEPMKTPYDAEMSQDELDKRDMFYKTINFVKSLERRDGEQDLSGTDRKRAGTINTDGLVAEHMLVIGPTRGGMTADLPTLMTVNLGDKEQAGGRVGSGLAHPFLYCKCGHRIGMVGNKWQHMLIDESPEPRTECHHCACFTPEPAEE